MMDSNDTEGKTSFADAYSSGNINNPILPPTIKQCHALAAHDKNEVNGNSYDADRITSYGCLDNSAVAGLITVTSDR